MIQCAKEGATLREAAPDIEKRLNDLNVKYVAGTNHLAQVRRMMAISRVTSGMYGLALTLHALDFKGKVSPEVV